MKDPLQNMRLVVVSHVTHYRFAGRLFAYGSYSQEIDVWADLFKEITIAAPCREECPPDDCLPFDRANISMAPQFESGGETVAAKVKLALTAPWLCVTLAKALWGADAIHVRCPGNLGLLGAALAPIFSRRLVAKYAAQWNSCPGEVWSSRLQKAILKSSWWRGPVTVYGEWPNQPKHIVPFFTSLLNSDHMERARRAAVRTWNGNPLEVLYTGRLSKAKNVNVLLRAVAKSRQEGFDIHCTIIGEGPERVSLEALSVELGISKFTEFTGGVAFEEVIHRLERAHVLALVSETEGWPKAIAEAMAFGLVSIGSNRGFVPKMLAEGRGLTATPGDAEGLAVLISDVARDPNAYVAMRRNAAKWSQRYSLEGLKNAIRELLLDEWKLFPTSAVTMRRAGGGAE